VPWTQLLANIVGLSGLLGVFGSLYTYFDRFLGRKGGPGAAPVLPASAAQGGGAKGGAGAPASALAGDDPEAGEAAEDDSLDLSAFGIFSSGDAADGGGGSGSSADATSSSSVAIFYELNATQSEEGLKISASYLKAEEQELQERRTEYDRRRGVMLLESKRLRAERESKFQNHPTIGAERRYILMELLGKGGFSEVWLAVDLFECREVAVKIHALSEHWSDDKKANYVRHALREFEIQQCLQHPNVVRLDRVHYSPHAQVCRDFLGLAAGAALIKGLADHFSIKIQCVQVHLIFFWIISFAIFASQSIMTKI
jgi:hypothetical protein